MNKKLFIGLGILMVGLALILSGCETSTKQASSIDSRLVGTWQGEMPLSTLNGQGNSTLTEITFTSSMAVLTIVSDYGTREMNCTYNMSSGSLVLTPQFSQGFGRRSFNNSQPPGNRPRPPYNGTWPNGTRPGNWSQWQNGSGPGNASRSPGMRRSAEMTFTYRFDENGALLYLDDALFTRVS